MSLWVVVGVIGVSAYLMRLSFVGTLGVRSMPAWAERPLRYVAPAVLAALVLPAVMVRDGLVDVLPASNPRFLAALIAAVVAWRTKNVAAVVVVGMVSLWLLQALL